MAFRLVKGEHPRPRYQSELIQHPQITWPTMLLKESVQSVQLLSHVQLFVTPWTAARQASLSNINSWSLLKLMSLELVIPSTHLILCYPLLLLTSLFPSVRFFSSESALCIRWPKSWSFSFSIRPSHEYLGLISFRTDRLDLFTVQGTLKRDGHICSFPSPLP